jgi:hypothetical protein
MQRLKSTFHLASRGKWQLDYETQCEFRQYYSTIQKNLYEGKYPNLLKSFMSTVPRYTFGKLFSFAQVRALLESISK